MSVAATPALSAEAVLESGLKRLRGLVTRYGITSPQVLASTERWGKILDDVTHESTDCAKCKKPIAWDSPMNQWVHTDANGNWNANAQHCLTVAGAEATPK